MTFMSPVIAMQAGSTCRYGYISISVDKVPCKSAPACMVLCAWHLAERGRSTTSTGSGLTTVSANLRDATPLANRQNQRRARSDSTTGFQGVENHGKKFSAVVKHQGRKFTFGRYATPEEAHSVYVREKRRLHEATTL